MELYKNYTDHDPRNVTAMYVKLTENAKLSFYNISVLHNIPKCLVLQLL